MTIHGVLTRSAIATALAISALALFGELRVGPAAFLMATIVLAGLARDFAAYCRAA